MDFRRVEAIFIAVFACLNLFLFYTYQAGKVEQVVASVGGVSENLEQRLQSERITYDETISDEKKEGYYLVAEPVSLYDKATQSLNNQSWNVIGSQLTSQFMNTDQMQFDLQKAEASLKTFIQNPENVLYGDSYVLSENDTVPMKKYVYYQTYEGTPFRDDTASIVLNTVQTNSTEGEVTGYVQSYVTDIKPLREKQPLISQREAWASLYTNNRLQSGDEIQWSGLGYIQIFTIRGKNVYIPAWIVSVQNSKGVVRTEKVNAFTSAVITSSVSVRDN